MFIYPIAFVAALIFSALSDLTVVLLAPTVARFHIPLLGVSPARIHSFAPLSLPSGTFNLSQDWSRYGSCVALDISPWGLPGLLTIPAVVDTIPSPSTTRTPEDRVSIFDLLVHIAVWYSVFTGIGKAASFISRLGSVINAQRMGYSRSTYSAELFAGLSLVSSQLGAPELPVFSSSDVPRIAPSILPVPPALAGLPCTPLASEKTQMTHGVARGGKRQHRRRHTLDFGTVSDNLAGLPPSRSTPEGRFFAFTRDASTSGSVSTTAPPIAASSIAPPSMDPSKTALERAYSPHESALRSPPVTIPS
ncbi:hypothetical protein GY45DRAFT_51711 [Cubamyces sp. BRFM 1775]|nr:hypothetical protein GY45DRAFT_51711 [Cubamyces sp. BRFM 1775]